MNPAARRTLAAAALMALALALLVAALLGADGLDPRNRPQVLVLVDRSHSMPPAAADEALAAAVQALHAAGAGKVTQIDFAGRPGAPAAGAALDPASTDVEAALQAALGAHAQAPLAGAVIISDGLANAGDTERALRAARDAELPLQWIGVGRPPPPARLAQVLAPRSAQAGQPIRVTVQLAGPAVGRGEAPLRVEALARAGGGATRSAAAEADADGRARLEIEAPGRGAVLIDLALRDPASGELLDRRPDAAAVDVTARAALLYVQGSATAVLAGSLRRGGWSIDAVPATRLDAQADGLDGYAAVVLDDVAVADAGARFWQALVDAVRQRGLGLLVLGGERSFARGGYRDSLLESVLPVAALPAALDRPASVMFAVDKSGSMGQGSGGVDRFQLARQAVLETAAGLSPRDALGLLLFDAAPRVVVPLGPAAAASAALTRDWRARPRGGTRIAPAIEAAVGELARAGSGRRLLVVVTDGFVDDTRLAGLRGRLDRERIEALALAVGPDADAAALARLFGAGSVMRVDQAAELPQLMKSGLERRRARVEQGRIEVIQPQALPFADGRLADWPPVAAFAVTQPQPEAVVAVATRSDEPLIAFRPAGRGRVAAVTSGLGPWTPQWLGWAGWPRLAGGLADWVAGARPGDRLSVSDGAAGIEVVVDLAGGAGGDLSVAVDTPLAAGQPVAAETVAPGRLRATLPDAGAGLYTVRLSTPRGSQRLLHLRRPHAEDGQWGLNPALAGWQRDGWVGAWDPARLLQGGGAKAEGPPDRGWVALALLLCGAAVLVDRTRPDGRSLVARLRRWRGWRAFGGR